MFAVRLSVGALLVSAAAAQTTCTMADGTTVPLSEVVAALNEPIVIPDNIAEYQIKMTEYPNGAEIADARTARNALHDTYTPRKGFAQGQDISADFIDVPARMCGLEYEARGADGWATPASINPKPGQNCTTAQMETYAKSLAVPVMLPLLFGILYIVLMPIWYFLRCCHCCGGRKPSTGRLCGLCCNNYQEQPAYATDARKTCSINFCRAMTFLCFILCAVAAIIGFVGNTQVDDGLRGTLDVSVYELRNLLQDGNNILTQMNSIASDMAALGPGGAAAQAAAAETTGAQTCNLAELDKTITDGEKDIEDMKDLVLEIRMLVVMIIFLVPLFFTLIFFVTNLLRCCWCLTCFGALLILVPGLLSFISAGVHLSIALVTADLCLDMDLHLHYYSYDNATRHLPESLPGAPADSLPCGPDGDFAFVSTEFDTKLDEVVQQACDLVKASCNANNVVAEYFMDCSGITLAYNGVNAWSGVYPNYACTASRNTPIGDLPTQLKLRDMGANAPTAVPATITQMPNDVLTCLCEGATTYAARNNVDYQTSWTSGAYSGAETTCLGNWATTAPTTAEMLVCYKHTNALVTMSACASDAAGSGCTAGTEQKLQAVNLTTTLTTAQSVISSLNALKVSKIEPILNCKFISEQFEAIYYPLCVEAQPGFTLITVSNVLSGIALVLAFPVAVASTKRIQSKGEPMDKYADDDMYKGQA